MADNLTIRDIAKLAGVSVPTVYRVAQELKRKPTVDEVTNRKKVVGRPTKYK